MINVNGLKRNAKNIVKKYSDAQIRVREATSNDPWGPSSTIMAEIADLTYNVVAFSEIMQMIWKRLNDHGKNWRHVYKALVVLEYIIKTGTQKVAQQCIENIFAIQTLKDFQYMEDNKDYGMNIREKSKKLVDLLKDSEKLKAERARALKAKSRLAESISSGLEYPNDSGSPSSAMAHLPEVASDLDSARPQTATEEENQLKLALALSKEEAEQQDKTRKNDELRLKLALDVSKKTSSNSTSLIDEFAPGPSAATSSSSQPAPSSSTTSGPSKSTIDDLLGLTIPAPEPTPAPVTIVAPVTDTIPEPQNDPWGPVDPWKTISTTHPLASVTSIAQPLPPQSSATTTTTSNNNYNLRTLMNKNPFED